MNLIARNCAPLRAAGRAASAGFLTAMLATLTLAASAAEWQTPQSIRDAATAAVRDVLGAASTAVVEPAGIDDRLKLPACTRTLDARIEQPLRQGRGVVAVSCTSGEPWRLFVPVRVVEQIAAVVTTRAVQPGQVLTAADVKTDTRASTTLPYEYLTAVEQAVGNTVRRTLPAGTVIVPAALDRPEVVTRGATVTLVSKAGSVLVRSEGVALQPARVNERIRVRSRSGRIVEGVVEASGEIRVGS